MTRRWLWRVNPVAKLATLLVPGLVLVLTLDPVLSGVVLMLSLAALALARAPLLNRAALVVWVSAPLVGLSMALYGRGSGEVFVRFGFAEVSEGSLTIALATMLRVLALALPAVVLFVTIDVTEFADALAQTLRLPSRFVLGALAGMRQLELAAEDWRMIQFARRARGLGEVWWLRRWLGDVGALFVLMVRRGGRLAMAMEARGFGPGPRTWTRQPSWGWSEWLLIGVGVLIAAIAVAVAVATGSWRFAWV